MLWRCCPFLVLRRSICDPQASGPLAGPKFQPPNKTRQHRRGLGTTDPVRQLWRDPKMVLQQSPIQPDRGSVALRRKTSDWPPQIHLWNVCDVTQESHLLHFPTSVLPPAGQMWYYRGSFGLFPRLTAGGSTPLLVENLLLEEPQNSNKQKHKSLIPAVNDGLWKKTSHHFV